MVIMENAMANKSIITLAVLVFAAFAGSETVWAKIDVHSLSAAEIELTGYNGLSESSLFKGELAADSKREINTSYRGLALLVFSSGQRYPVIIGDKSFTLKIIDPGKPPSFADSDENNFFYRSLSGGDFPLGQYDFVLLMIRTKNLLESSQSIKTFVELIARKQEFHSFIRENYDYLKHSDMIKRLIAQYFMMHEYVDYHTEGAPAVDIRVKYQKEVIKGVGCWLDLLPGLPRQEILNYCVSLYYKRSMVTLASLIIENFRDIAYCPGEKKESLDFPAALTVVAVDGGGKKNLGDIKGEKLVSLVSEDCPVSMVETVVKARQLSAKGNKMPVIVAPLEKLSGNHLTVSRMISNGTLLFIDDEKWRKENLTKKIQLPLFVRLGENIDVR